MKRTIIVSIPVKVDLDVYAEANGLTPAEAMHDAAQRIPEVVREAARAQLDRMAEGAEVGSYYDIEEG